MRAAILLILTSLGAGFAPVSAISTSSESDGPIGIAAFADAMLAPADVSVYLQVDDAAALNERFDGWPIAQWIEQSYRTDALGEIWNQLSGNADMGGGQLFRALFGRQLTLLSRVQPIAPEAINAGAEAPPQRADWVIIAHVGDDLALNILRALRAVPQSPVAGVPVRTLPEQNLVIGGRDGVFVCAPADERTLFEDVVRRVGGDHHAPNFRSTDAFVKSTVLGNGQLCLFTRHQTLASDGWSVARARVRGDKVDLRYAGTFENPPFSRSITQSRCDFSLIAALEDVSIATFIEPTDIGQTPFELFMEQTMGASFASRHMRENTGERRIVVFGEEEARLREKPVDVLAPTVALCRQARDATGASLHLDQHMTGLCSTVYDRFKLRQTLADPPTFEDVLDGTPRQVELSPAAAWITGNLPIFNRVQVCWDVVETEAATWYVIATDPAHLKDVARALKRMPVGADNRPAIVGTYDSVGVINGMRLGHHLASWRDRADELAQPGLEKQFQASLDMLSRLSHCFERVSWKLTRPTTRQIELEISMRLAPNRSRGIDAATDDR